MGYLDERLTEIQRHVSQLTVAVAEDQDPDTRRQLFESLGAVIREELLNSYRNGQRACPKCHPRPARRAQAS
ncbi:MAG: hypothetical protein D4R93_03375 [Deltaproteobacteria bacterium]|nr:MAG: hypothetical protein D4R93_03375 [Deltaproteobacteria bacterium]